MVKRKKKPITKSDSSMAYIEVNDLFSEFLAENERLVNVLNELKSYLKTIHTKYETMIADEDIKQWQTLQQSMDTTVEEYNSNYSLRVIKLKKEIHLNKESTDGKQSGNNNNNIDVNEEDISQLPAQPLCQTTVTTSIQEPEADSNVETSSNTSNQHKKSLSNICESDSKLLLLLKNCTIDDKTQRFLCPITDCDRSYRTKHILQKHFRYNHYKSHTKRFSCSHPDCNYRTNRRDLYNIHIEIHNVNRTKNYQCLECDKSYLSKSNLTKHIHTKHLKKKFKCGINGCTTMFTTCHSRILHRESVHHMKYADRTKQAKYICQWPGCDYRSTSDTNLRDHIRKHTGERPYRCEWPDCQQRFARKTGLKRHVICHQNLKPYVCQWPGCDYRGNCHSNYYAHKKIHQRQ